MQILITLLLAVMMMERSVTAFRILNPKGSRASILSAG